MEIEIERVSRNMQEAWIRVIGRVPNTWGLGNKVSKSVEEARRFKKAKLLFAYNEKCISIGPQIVLYYDDTFSSYLASCRRIRAEISSPYCGGNSAEFQIINLREVR